MATTPFLDFVDQYMGGSNAIPSWLAGMLTKRPSTNLSDAAPYFNNVGNMGNAAAVSAGNNAAFTDANYKPAAVDFNQRAQGVGGTADLAEASNRGAADFQAAHEAARANAERTLAGANPNSGAAQARLSAIDAAYAPGVVDAMNKARTGREAMGYQLRATALPFLNLQPNYGAAGSLYATAGAGTAGLARYENDASRQQAADIVKALKMGPDATDNARRAAGNNESLFSRLGQFKNFLGMGNDGYNAPMAPAARASAAQAAGDWSDGTSTYAGRDDSDIQE